MMRASSRVLSLLSSLALSFPPAAHAAQGPPRNMQRLIRRTPTLRVPSRDIRQELDLGCECCTPTEVRRRQMMTNMLGAGIAGSAGLIDLANRDKLMRRPGEKKEVIGKSSFAWCMANRMGSYESSVREAKERLFTSCFEAIRTRKQATNEVKPSNILEVGVGPGPNMPMYSKMLESGDRVWGVDANAYMGEYASQSAKAAGVPFEFMEGDAQRLPFQDNSFDAVVVSHVLCSVSDPIKAIREISRVLVPGGVFLFWEHIGAWEDKPMLRMQQDVLDPLQQVFFQGCHLNRDSLAAIERSKTFESIDARKFYIGDRMLLSPHAAGLAFKSKAS